MFGLIYTILILTCWKLESYPLLYWMLFIPTMFLLIQGRYWGQDWAFPEIHHFNWWIAIQYVSAIFTVFFLIVFALRSIIRKYILSG